MTQTNAPTKTFIEASQPAERDLEDSMPEPAPADLPTIVKSDTVRASWNFSLDRIRADTAHFPQEAQEALIALFLWCIDGRHPMRRSEAAARIGCSENLLYQLYTGSYRDPKTKEPRYPSDELLRHIADFLALEQKRYDAGTTEFVLTPTAQKIYTACDLARESQTPVILWGPSHIGKTWSFRSYQQSNNHGRTILVELEAASGLGGMVRRLADASGISDRSNTASLIDRVKRAWNQNTLVIIDEVHLLKHTYRLGSFFACIEVLRRLYDHCRCGMVLSWTNIENLQNASQGELVQLWRRGVHKIALPLMPTKGDIKAILAHNGLDFPARDLTITVAARRETIVESPYEILRQLAKRDGLLAITERVRYARKLATKTGDRLSWAHFVDAHLRVEKQAIAETEWS
jgi:DNA transposition AAA+ family ATPase